MIDATNAMRVAFPRWPREGLARLNGTLRALEGPLGDSLRELEARISTLVGAEIERVGALDARLRERRPVSDDRFSLALRKGDGRCTIELDRELAREIAARAVGASEREVRAPLPLSALEQGLCRYALFRALSGSALGEGWALDLADAGGWSVEIRQPLRLGRARGCCTVALAIDASSPVTAGIVARPSLSPVLSACPLALACVLARRVLTLSELRRVEPGGWIFFGTMDDWRRVSLLVESRPAPLFRGRLEGDRIQIEERTMERFTEPEAPRGDASLALDELELRVEVVVGECRVPLGELAQLSAGQALLLHRATEDGVEVRVQGRTIGEGELIDVDGVLAVRLTKWDGGTL